MTAGWRGLFAYVPQGNQLMNGTVREIITFGDRSQMGQDERIWRALEIACAADFMKEQKDGLDLMLGERGAGLSEGQMQRIAIARAVFSNHPILLLDESTSALDEDTEKHLLQNLKAMTDKTVLIVTHRPAVLEICDKKIEVG
jgi:ATP-binding cassette subfamily B protein